MSENSLESWNLNNTFLNKPLTKKLIRREIRHFVDRMKMKARHFVN